VLLSGQGQRKREGAKETVFGQGATNARELLYDCQAIARGGMLRTCSQVRCDDS